jgi:hypothetical protein
LVRLREIGANSLSPFPLGQSNRPVRWENERLPGGRTFEDRNDAMAVPAPKSGLRYSINPSIHRSIHPSTNQ